MFVVHQGLRYLQTGGCTAFLGSLLVQAEAVKQNFKKKKEPENMKKITDAIWKRKIFTAKTK